MESKCGQKIEISQFVDQILFYLELFHCNLKTIQAVKEAADDHDYVPALVNHNMIHYAMVNF
jgi:hypothetical protein